MDSEETATYEPDEIMERDYSRVGGQDYDLPFNNCENFAIGADVGD